MVTTKELKGSKEQIARQLEQVNGEILSVILVVDEKDAPTSNPVSDEDFQRIMKEMEADTVSAPHADDSREAIYTRMAGE